MSNRIEWHQTVEFSPPPKSIQAFCREKGIAAGCVEPGRATVVFVRQTTLDAIYASLSHDTSREHIGVLIGLPFHDQEQDRFYVDIHQAVLAAQSKGSPVYAKFSPDDWSSIADAMAASAHNPIVVGWYHSHPRLGIFMSGTDRATQAASFNHPWNLALVHDPVSEQTGWFVGEACTPMDSAHVIVYNDPPDTAILVPDVALRPAGSRRLPYVVLLALLLAGFWYVKTRRALSG